MRRGRWWGFGERPCTRWQPGHGARSGALSSTARRHGSPSGRRPAPGPPRCGRLRRLRERLPAVRPTMRRMKRSATSAGPWSATVSAWPPADRPGHQSSQGEGRLERADRGHGGAGGAGGRGRSRRRGCGRRRSPAPGSVKDEVEQRDEVVDELVDPGVGPRWPIGRTPVGRRHRSTSGSRRAIRRNGPRVERAVDEHHAGCAVGFGRVRCW